METWNQFNENYRISNLGNVKGTMFMELKQYRNKKGYEYVNVRENGKYKRMYIHNIINPQAAE